MAVRRVIPIARRKAKIPRYLLVSREFTMHDLPWSHGNGLHLLKAKATRGEVAIRTWRRNESVWEAIIVLHNQNMQIKREERRWPREA